MNKLCDFGSRFRILKGGKISLVVSAMVAGTTISFASPTDGVVTSGTASISQSGNTTNITQTTDKASINWNKFNIASNETVNFIQPNPSSITLNRVIGNEKSVIDGALNANGQVWILNSNGVLFGKNASINTSGILATTKELSDTDFQNGNYDFKGNSSESVINLGLIEVSNNGSVVLAANEVINSGTIKAVRGKVHLVGANEYTVNLNGNSLVNLTVNKGVLDAMVENSGTISASGGEIYLTTNAVNELLKGVVNNTGIIEVNSLDGLMGKVEVFAHGGTANVSGTIEAKDGFVETSGKVLHVSDGTTIKAKTWLLDPTNITIADGGGDAVDATTDEVTISASTIESAINNDGTMVWLEATNDINVNQTLNFSGTTSFILQAGHDINVNEAITASRNLILFDAKNNINVNAVMTIETDASLWLGYGWDGGPNYGIGNTAINMGMNADKTDFIGKVNLVGSSTLSINNVEQTIIQDAGGLAAMNSNKLGNYVLGANISMTVDGNNNNFTPIGMGTTPGTHDNAFIGKFNGLGHTITDIIYTANSIERDGDNAQAAGLFGHISNADVSNIRLDHSNFTNANSGEDDRPSAIGGIAAYAIDSKISNAIVTSHYDEHTPSYILSFGGSMAGGVVGYGEGVTISNAAVSNTVIQSYARGDIGGIAGRLSNSSIDNSQVTGVTAMGLGSGVGGLVGTITGGTISGSTVSGSHMIGFSDVGGLFGKVKDLQETMNNSSGMPTITNSFYKKSDTDIGLATIEDDTLTPVVSPNALTWGGLYDTEYNAWISGGKVAPTPVVDGNGFFVINNEADFKKALQYVYTPGIKLKLGADITLSDGVFLPALYGELDGNNHTITGLNIDQSYNGQLGLVGWLVDGNIHNLTIAGATLSGYANVGAAAGIMMSSHWDSNEDDFTAGSTVDDVTVTGLNYNYTKIIADATPWSAMVEVANIGGVVGLATSHSTITNASSAGTIGIDIDNQDDTNWQEQYIYSIGGIVGNAVGSSIKAEDLTSATATTIAIKNTSTLKGIVSLESVGGIVGEMRGYDDLTTLKNATASGAITITSDSKKQEGITISGIGGIAGELDGVPTDALSATNAISITSTIANAGSTEVTGVGGISGYFSDSTFGTATRSGDIDISIDQEEDSSTIGEVGQYFGYASTLALSDLVASGTITLKAYNAQNIGGLVGYAEDVNILNSSSSVVIDATDVLNGSYAGGLVGNFVAENEDYESSIIDSSATGSVTAPHMSKVGGLVGSIYIDQDIVGGIENSHATGEVKGFDNVGGLVGYNNKSNIENSYATGKVTGTGENAGGLVGYTEGNAKGETYQNNYFPTEESDAHYETAAAAQVALDLALNEYLTTGAGKTLLDDGYTQSGTHGVELSSQFGIGYIWSIDLKFSKDATIGLITDSYATGVVDGANYVGGLVGYANKANIENVNSSAIVTGVKSVGGLVGSSNNSSIKNSYATGKVTATGSDGDALAGGLVGGAYSNSTISQSYASGQVIASAKGSGGLIGGFGSTTIENSYATGAVTGTDYVGGLLGRDLGGSTIRNVYSSGDVTFTAVNGTVGGLIGGLSSGTTLSNSYTSSKIIIGTNTGVIRGLIGSKGTATSTNSFYDKTVNPGLIFEEIYGKTTAELKTLATYAAWDMGGVNGNYPILGFQTADAATIWVMGEASSGATAPTPIPTPVPEPTAPTPVPEPTKTVETKEAKEANKVVAAIANTAAIKVAIPKITPPVIQPQARPVITSNVNLGFGEGAKVNLVSRAIDGQPTKAIKLSEIKAMQPEKKDQNGNPVVQDTRVALSDDSVIDLINDGVNLPDGVEQEFYVVEDKRN